MPNSYETVKIFNQGKVCPGCVVLQEEVREIKRTLDDIKRDLDEMIKEIKREKENRKVLLCADDLISILYTKMFKYSRSQGLSRKVDLEELLASSDSCSESENPKITAYFYASLQYLGMSLVDFECLRAQKLIRNDDFDLRESPTELLNTIKSARQPEYEEFIAIIEKYPTVFNIN